MKLCLSLRGFALLSSGPWFLASDQTRDFPRPDDAAFESIMMQSTHILAIWRIVHVILFSSFNPYYYHDTSAPPVPSFLCRAHPRIVRRLLPFRIMTSEPFPYQSNRPRYKWKHTLITSSFSRRLIGAGTSKWILSLSSIWIDGCSPPLTRCGREIEKDNPSVAALLSDTPYQFTTSNSWHWAKLCNYSEG